MPANRFARVGIIILVSFFLFVFLSTLVVVANKKTIIAKITGSVSHTVNAKIAIGDVGINIFKEFPYTSIQLKNVEILDSAFDRHKIPLLKAESVLFSINPSRLFSKKPPVRGISFENAEINLFTDSTGYSNEYILKGNGKKQSSGKVDTTDGMELKRLAFYHSNFTLTDAQKNKHHDIMINDLVARIKDEGRQLDLNIHADLFIKSLAFNTRKGSYLHEKSFTGKFRLDYLKEIKRLGFDDIDLKIDREKINLTGFIDLGKDNPQFRLHIKAPTINYAKVQSFLPVKIGDALKIVHIESPLNAVAEINGPLKGEEPFIRINARAENTDLLNPFLDFNSARFDVVYTNEAVKGVERSDANSLIKVTNFAGKWHSIPVASNNIEILDLMKPQLTGDLTSDFDLTQLNEYAGNSFNFKNGRAKLNLHYKGPLEKNDNTNSFLNGDVTFSKGRMVYLARNIEADDITGQLRFSNSNLLIPQLDLTVFGQRLNMNGSADNLLSLINKNPNSAIVKWNINAPSLDLTIMTAFFRQKTRASFKKTGKNNIDDFAAKLDQVLDKGRFDLNLNANNVSYKKFNASAVAANLSLLETEYIINSANLKSSAGNILINGGVKNSGKTNNVNLNAKFNKVDVSDVFRAFNNFGQDGIEHQNIKGILDADVVATMKLHEDGSVMPSSIVSTVNFNLQKGELIKYEPLKKIQKFVFKKRNFDHIVFAPIKNKFEIANQDIKINRMEISSSVLRMFIEGVYSMRGKTDISIQVPFSNLRKPDPDDVPTNIGVNTLAGRSIFLRGIPVPGTNSVTIALDLFKTYHRDKKAGDKEKSRKN